MKIAELLGFSIFASSRTPGSDSIPERGLAGRWPKCTFTREIRRAPRSVTSTSVPNDLGKAIAFYKATLAPFGMERCITGDPEWDHISAGWGI